MSKFEATYSFNVRRFIKREIEADTPEEAARIAREEAWPCLDEEITRFQNSDGFADTEPLDPVVTLDGPDAEEILWESLPAPAPYQDGPKFGTMPDGSPALIVGRSAETVLRRGYANSRSPLTFDAWTAAVAAKDAHPLNAKAREFLNVDGTAE